MADITEKTENCELVANCDRLVAVDNIEPLIKVIRGQQVMLDKDLATLYGVEAKVLNQAVKRNIERFPDDFRFQLTREECLRSQIVTLNEGRGSFMVKTASVFSRLETIEYLSGKRQGFTDKLFKINNLSGRKRGFTDEGGVGSPGQMWTVVLRTNLA